VKLFVVADADPGTLLRVLQRFASLNLVPRRVIAERCGEDLLHIEVDAVNCSPRLIEQIAAKLSQLPTIHDVSCRPTAVESANVAGRATHGSTI
jgi:hypothetical protein